MHALGSPDIQKTFGQEDVLGLGKHGWSFQSRLLASNSLRCSFASQLHVRGLGANPTVFEAPPPKLDPPTEKGLR